MFSRPFHPDRFLRSVYGSEPFIAYCRERRIAFEQSPTLPLQKEDARRWTAALAELPREQHAQLELDLATVNEMAGGDAIAHLLEAAEGKDLPPDAVPNGAPVALWFFLRYPPLFREVFLHYEIEEVDCWRTAQAALGLDVSDLADRTAGLAEGLRAYFRPHEESGAFCTVEAHRLQTSCCFIGQVADRLQFLDAFTDRGQATTQRVRPAQTVLFVYYPEDGTVLLKSPLRSRERTAQLFDLFGKAVLGSAVRCDEVAFHLEPLKEPFHPLPDGEDMEMVRVKALHLRYPPRAGRRQLKLETLSSDEPAAIDHLLLSHVGHDALDQLRVAHAELQVRLRIEGESKSYAIRLWPNRCNISQTPLGDRFRSCLKRWGLSHAREQ
jgi:hypothetical protein